MERLKLETYFLLVEQNQAMSKIRMRGRSSDVISAVTKEWNPTAWVDCVPCPKLNGAMHYTPLALP